MFSSLGCFRILSHFVNNPAAVLAISGCVALDMMLAMANRSLSLDGAESLSAKAVPGLMKGIRGHLHFSEGGGPMGKWPSPIFMPGQPANLLSGVLLRSSAEAGKSKIVYLHIIPFLPEEVLDG